MTRIAANAQLTNQGRADLQRSPTSPQIAFNQNGDSQISALRALLASVKEGEVLEDRFSTLTPRGSDPSAFQPTRLSLFLWMTDRVIVSWAEQFYAGTVHPPDIPQVTQGANLTTNAARCLPTNGMAGLVSGVTCTPTTPVTDFGKQAVLSYGTGPNALSVRGTPMLLELSDNAYFDNLVPPLQRPEQPTVTVTAFSESLLSGRHGQASFTVLPNGEIDIYGATAANREQVAPVPPVVP